METKKAYCYLCTNGDDKSRIFDINSKLETTNCPVCGKQIIVKTAILAYENRFKELVKKASIKLNEESDFNSAYKMYANIIGLDNKNTDAIFGRIISLLKMSTLRVSKFEDASLLLTLASKTECVQNSNPDNHLEFLQRIVNICKIYLTRITKKLMIKTYFYDGECLHLYLSRLDEISSLLNIVLKELENLKDRFKDIKDIEPKIESLKSFIDRLNEESTKNYVLADGCTMIVSRTPSGQLLLTRNDSNLVSTKLQGYRLSTLYPKDRDLISIKDVVFPNRSSIYHLNKLALPISLVSFIASLVLTLITVFFEPRIVIGSFAILLFVSSLVFGFIKLMTNKKATK
ncbi:MAG: hypothetical protein VB015_02215 [Erysipelotrichaceae bacterium]|nr:hypothetical protein [Erysipelotrichaceae bacterium]